MVISAYIELPDNVQLRHVAEVVGRLMGGAAVTTRSTCSPEMAEIVWKGGTLKGWEEGVLYYHFEGTTPELRRWMMPSSRAVWVAMGTRLVDFFGGRLTYREDQPGGVYELPAKRDEANCPEDDRAWEILQQRIMDEPPLTAKEIRVCKDLAAQKL